jgi:putative phosphoribosyl transferase
MRPNGVYVSTSTFRDRKDAGQLLAGRLATRRYAQPVVIALSRGGVPVAFEVAKLLDAPLDVVLFGDGIAAADGSPSGRDSARIDPREHDEIARLESKYRSGRPPTELATRTVIVVDESMSSGAPVKAALQRLRSRQPKRIVVGTPVAPRAVIDEIEPHADDMTCLFVATAERALADFYAEFSAVSDAEVIALMERAADTRRAS